MVTASFHGRAFVGIYCAWEVLVRGAGVEPACPFGHGALNAERLPIPPAALEGW